MVKKYTCENCGKDHDGTYGSGRFCSEHCRRQFCGRKNLKPVNNLPKRQRAEPWVCKYCNAEFRTRKELNEHKHKVHPESCGKSHKAWNKGLTALENESIARGREKWLKSLKEGKFSCSHEHTQETKEKISKSRLRYMQNHPESMPFIKYNFHKGRSYAETYFEHFLIKNNIDFIAEKKEKYYSLDFVIGNVDLEIDGEQHYNFNRIIESDKRRTQYLESIGYRVIRVRWSTFKSLNETERKQFLNDLLSELKRE